MARRAIAGNVKPADASNRKADPTSLDRIDDRGFAVMEASTMRHNG
jgi:hypothetical protein